MGPAPPEAEAAEAEAEAEAAGLAPGWLLAVSLLLLPPPEAPLQSRGITCWGPSARQGQRREVDNCTRQRCHTQGVSGWRCEWLVHHSVAARGPRVIHAAGKLEVPHPKSGRGRYTYLQP